MNLLERAHDPLLDFPDARSRRSIEYQGRLPLKAIVDHGHDQAPATAGDKWQDEAHGQKTERISGDRTPVIAVFWLQHPVGGDTTNGNEHYRKKPQQVRVKALQGYLSYLRNRDTFKVPRITHGKKLLAWYVDCLVADCERKRFYALLGKKRALKHKLFASLRFYRKCHGRQLSEIGLTVIVETELSLIIYDNRLA